jgi:hypothetical protein
MTCRRDCAGARLFHLADTVEVFHRAGGAEAAVEVARARRGTHFDPEIGRTPDDSRRCHL